MKPICVEVTQEDIEKGVPWNERKCPLARALNRTTGGSWYVTRSGATDHSDPMKLLKYVSLTDAAVKFERDFDHGRQVKPGRFVLTLWDGVLG